MSLKHLSILTVSLALAACTADKGDSDGTAGSTSASASSGGTDSASSSATAGTTAGTTTGDDPTGGSSEPGTGTTEPTGEGNDPCIDTPTVLAVDEASALGFSAAQLLEGKLGMRTATLTFAGEPTTLSEDLKNKQLPLAVDLRHNGGEVRFIDSSPNPDYDDSGNESGFIDCTDRLEVDVEFDFVTEAKEFDEHREGVLVATTVDRAQLDVELAPPGLEGSFDPATAYADPEWVVTRLNLSATWQGALAGGSVLNEVLVGGADGFAGYGPLAGWGDPIDL